MRNIKLTLQYDGTRYLGWQKPIGDRQEKTVSHRLCTVLERITGESVSLYAGAKTEVGVHALSQTVNFYTETRLHERDLQENLNRYLPTDIAIRECKTVPDRFRADLNARSKTYEYRICTAPVYGIFTSSYTTHLHPAPNIDLMEKGAGFLLGKHDFLPFSRSHKKKGTVRELMNIDFSIPEEEADILKISMTADDFLYRMPFLITGTLLEIGKGIRTPESVRNILGGTEKAEAICEAKGLLLKSVQYDDHM